MDEAQARAAVVAEAKTWIGTPWRHNQALKGLGVDCGRYLMAVYVAAGIIESFDPGSYSQQWNLHRREEVYLGYVQAYAGEIAAADARPGDCILFRFGHTYSHGGIIIDPPRLLHAFVRQGVVEADYQAEIVLASHEPRFFSPWSRLDGR